MPYPQSYKRLYFFQFSTYIFSVDITPEMLKLGMVTKVNVFFLVLVYVFNIDLFEFSAAILEKGILIGAANEYRGNRCRLSNWLPDVTEYSDK